ncbi:uncharacterized protein [Linepithema humile]|uniref:uncharacterized protein n=1 Tax=Linepithema humile TaxID=83485 RepID=UPI00351F1FE9
MEADLMVSCPYNPAHRIRKAKLMAHVAKCKKSSKIENKATCPLDSSHIVDRDQLDEHIISCPGLANLITDVDYLNTDQNAEQAALIDSSRSVENWDEEPEVPPYNPMEVSENKKVLRSVAGLSKAERRKFRNKERMRMAQLNAEDLDASVGTSCSVKDADTSLYSLYSLRRSDNVSNDAHTSSANNLDKSSKQNASIQTNISHEFDDPFHRTLYNEFAPENDNLNELLEQSLHHAELFNKSLIPETKSAKDNSYIDKEKQDFPNFGQNENTKIELDAVGGLFNTNNLKQEKSECAASAAVSCERDDLSTLLKNLNAMKAAKEELNRNDKDLSQKEWDEMFDRFNILTNVQNAAAEESAQLLQQLSKLKLRQEVPPKK